MSTLFLAVLGSVFLVSLLANGFFLWAACKLFGVRRANGAAPAGISYRRAVAVVLGLWLTGTALAVLLGRFAGEQSARGPLLALGAHLALFLLLLFAFLRVFLSTTFGQTLLVGVVWCVMNAVYGVAVMVGVVLLVAEAFIHPTGSMAETLLGHHKEVTCPACGLTFPVNASMEAEPSEAPPVFVSGCTCPNCRQRIRFIAPFEEGRAREGPHADDKGDEVWLMKDPGVTRGDRVVVGKGLFGARLVPPDRLDWVVFDHQVMTEGEPRSVRYLKRLVGLPGETVALHGGKVYLLEGLRYEDAAALGQELGPPDVMHRDEPDALRRFEAGEFRVLRKPPEQVLAMMRLVHDNDHPAEDLKGPDWQRWLSKGKAWQPDGATGFRGEAEEAQTHWLRYRHRLRGQDRPQLVTDFLGYNTWEGGAHAPPGENWTHDLILECEVTAEAPEGEFLLELSAGADRFQARFNLADGTCSLYRLSGDEEEKLDSRPSALKGKGTYRVRLANVDERLTVWVDERLPFGDGVAYDAPRDVRPVKENDLERPAGIGVAGSKVGVRHVKLFRDTYYTVGSRGAVSRADVDGFDPSDPPSWDKVKHSPVATYYVRPGHYFVLGDNSAESGDSRSWGPVPQRLLLGKAFFVYYPFRRAGRPR